MAISTRSALRIAIIGLILLAVSWAYVKFHKAICQGYHEALDTDVHTDVHTGSMLEFYCEDGFLAPGLLSCLWDFLALMVTSVCTETFVFHKKIVWALLKGDPYYAAYSTAVLIGEVLAAAASMWFWSLEGSLDSLDTRFWNRSAKHEHRLDELEERTSSNEAWIHTTVDDSRAAEAGHYRWWAGTNAMLNALDFRTTEITNTASATDTRLSAALQHFSQGWTRLTRAERLLRRQATTLAALQHYSSAKRTCNRRHRLAFRQSKGSSHGVQSCRRPGAQPARSVQQCRRRTARPAALYRRQRSPVSQTEASPVQTNWAALGRQLAAAMEQRDKQQQLRSLGLTHPDDLALARGVMWQLKAVLDPDLSEIVPANLAPSSETTEVDTVKDNNSKADVVVPDASEADIESGVHNTIKSNGSGMAAKLSKLASLPARTASRLKRSPMGSGVAKGAKRDESSGPFKGAASAGIVVPLEVRTNLPPQPAATHVPTVDGGSGSNAHDSGSGSSDHDGKENSPEGAGQGRGKAKAKGRALLRKLSNTRPLRRLSQSFRRQC